MNKIKYAFGYQQVGISMARIWLEVPTPLNEQQLTDLANTLECGLRLFDERSEIFCVILYDYDYDEQNPWAYTIDVLWFKNRQNYKMLVPDYWQKGNGPRRFVTND